MTRKLTRRSATARRLKKWEAKANGWHRKWSRDAKKLRRFTSWLERNTHELAKLKRFAPAIRNLAALRRFECPF